jgi:hypothetical protein
LEKKNMLDPICIAKGTSTNPNANADELKATPKTMVRFCHGAPVLITGDVTGDVSVFRLNREEEALDPSFQAEKLMKLLYPNGYKLGNNAEEHGEEPKDMEESSETKQESANDN